MRGIEFTELNAFAAVASQGSFTRAAAQLRVSAPALSQTVRRLEERLGVRLLNRTTRSVSPTQAGARLLAKLRPVFDDLHAAVTDVKTFRERPAGIVRINAARVAVFGFLAPLVGRFCKKHPDIVLDIASDDALTDIVEGRFDIGVRLGEKVDKDMVAVKLSGPLSTMVVASQDYLERHGTPKTPYELHRHRCINLRFTPNGNVYRWEFARGKKSLDVAVEGPLIVDDADILLRAVRAGVGIGYGIDEKMRRAVERGRIVRILEAWSPTFPGFYLYYPSRRQTPPALRAFIDFVREHAPS
ncbi:LysR family transcriptional regulator [Pendulispora brunnea]|uniref:LysR family transcriptional regulator n=1 Tax=Pendulispora brunnea TaxID=2905690 RepID=A0ABZ2K1N8_9BACT